MKNSIFLLLLATTIIFFSFPVNAYEENLENSLIEIESALEEMGNTITPLGEGDHETACNNLILDEAQKKLLKKLMFRFKVVTIPAEKLLKVAKHKLHGSIIDAEANQQGMMAFLTIYIKGLAKLKSYRYLFMKRIMENVMRPEQRKDGFLCLAPQIL